MDISKLKVKEINELFKAGDIKPELIEACRMDGRPACLRAVEKYEKQQAKLAAEKARVDALYKYEYEAINEGLQIVAGVDEAGRGPLAGPVSVAAVILPPGLFLPKLNDSKKVSAKVRDELYDMIMEKAVCVRHEFVDEATIDRVNILQATMNGMYDCIFGLEPRPDKVLIDAVRLEHLPMPCLPIIKGDAKSASIAAASIIAKVKRDRLMDEYDKMYPEYGFAGHKGYGTAEHVAAIRKYGPCPIHRRSFEPIRSMIGGSDE